MSQASLIQPPRSQKRIFLLNIFIITGLAFVLAGFLAQYDQLISQDYELRECKKMLVDQQEAEKNLKVRLTELNSIENIQGMAKNLNLVAAENVKYLEAGDSAMAMSGTVSR